MESTVIVTTFIRVDASAQMGIGHVMRCLALAEGLRERDWQVRFLCADCPGHMAAYLRQCKFDVALLPTSDRMTASESNADDRNETTQSEDANQTIRALNGVRPDWLIVDQYSLGSEWEAMLRPHANRILVIDDLANRNHDCDVLIDQNFSGRLQSRYRTLTNEGCRELLGPRFALLRQGFRLQRDIARSRDGTVKRVLITFGGSDSLNMTGLVLGALSAPEFEKLEIDVVVGINNPHFQLLQGMANARPRTVIHGVRRDMEVLMWAADLSIGAGGITTWERMCVGLPSIIFSIAENQRPACEALAESGLIAYAGNHTLAKSDRLSAILRQLVLRPDLLLEMSIKNQLLVDGWGVSRVIELLCPTAKVDLRLRRAQSSDSYQYFFWISDPSVRAQSIQMHPIRFEEHQAWFAKKLLASDSHLFVLEANNFPVGQIRFELVGDEARIGYSIDALFRGRGWASHLVKLGLQEFSSRAEIVFRAEVKESNLPSCAVFVRLGFVEYKAEHCEGLRFFRLRSSK